MNLYGFTLASSTVGPLRTTVLIAGDDADAKALPAGGDGALRRARELEALGFLELTLAVSEKVPRTGGFGVVA